MDREELPDLEHHKIDVKEIAKELEELSCLISQFARQLMAISGKIKNGSRN